MAGILSLLNFLLFRFAIVRKIVFALSSILLIACGFDVGGMLERESYKYAGSHLGWDNSNIDTMILISSFMLLMAVLMTFGDSLLDFEESTEYNVDVSEFLGSYYLNVSEHTCAAPQFYIYYAISTAAAVLVYFLGIEWLRWFYIYGILGCIFLAYLVIIKPLILKFVKRY